MIKRQIGKIEAATIEFVAKKPSLALVEETRAALAASRDDNAEAVRVLDKYQRQVRQAE